MSDNSEPELDLLGLPPISTANARVDLHRLSAGIIADPVPCVSRPDPPSSLLLVRGPNMEFRYVQTRRNDKPAIPRWATERYSFAGVWFPIPECWLAAE